MKRSTLMIIGAALLLQSSVALSRLRHRRDAGLATLTQQQYNDFASNKPAAQERRELLIATLGEMAILAKYTVQQGLTLFKDTLQQLNALPEEQLAALQPNISRMSQFVESAEMNVDILHKPDNIMQLFVHMQSIGAILQNVEEAPTAEPAITLQKALTQSGLKEFEEGFAKRFAEFYDEFNKLLEAFLQNLSKAEKEAFPALMEWIVDFKAETDFIKKHAKFELFFVLLVKGY